MTGVDEPMLRLSLVLLLGGCAASPPPRPLPPPVAVEASVPRAGPAEPEAPTEPEVEPEAPAEPEVEPAAASEPEPGADQAAADAEPGPRPSRPRVVHRRERLFAPDGTEDPPPPEVPPGYVTFEPPSPAPRLAGTFWLVGLDPRGEGPSCERWRARATREGAVLERRYPETFGSARAVMREFVPLYGGPLAFDMFCTGYERRWVRRPRPDEGMPGMRGACGAVYSMTIVAADAERVVWLEARNVLAYHPADVRVWYRTEEACQASLEPEAAPGPQPE